MQRRLQSLAHAKWPPKPHPKDGSSPSVVSDPAAVTLLASPTPVASPLVLPVSAKPVVPLVSGPVLLPTPAPKPPLVLEAYDVTKCHRACPLCEKEFPGLAIETHKQLVKHIKDHRPDPANLRFKSWLQAANRSWCEVCQWTPSNRLKHTLPQCQALHPVQRLRLSRLLTTLLALLVWFPRKSK